MAPVGAAGPDPFQDSFVAMASARALISATRLGVIEALAEEPASADALAAELGLDPVGVEALLTALVALGYVADDSAGRHRLTEAGRRLAAADARSVAAFVGAYGSRAWEMLGGLDRRLRGKPESDSHRHPPDDPFWDSYIRGMYELTREEHDRAIALLPNDEPATMLDLGGGHGGFAMAMCRRHAGLRATVLDLAGSAEVGRRIVAENGLAERISFRAGDVVATEYGSGFDVVSAFNLLHHLPADDAREVLRRARGALRDGGILVVGETERREPGEAASLNGAMSGLVYYVSSGVRNYTRGELDGWVREAGFAAPQVHRSESAPWRLMFVART